MNIDVYTMTGAKKTSQELPSSLFAVEVNEGLIHQAIVRQQSNRRHAIAHVKTRSEVAGSTRKLFQQKGTGRARRGDKKSPVLRGGGQAFGPRNTANFEKDMPKKMRRKALASSLSLQAKAGIIFGLEYAKHEPKTKVLHDLLSKLPVNIGRSILFVTPSATQSLQIASRNIPGVKVITVPYLNPEDIIQARHIIFLTDAIEKAVDLFVDVTASEMNEEEVAPKKVATKKDEPKKVAAKKPTTKKSSTTTVS